MSWILILTLCCGEFTPQMAVYAADVETVISEGDDVSADEIVISEDKAVSGDEAEAPEDDQYRKMPLCLRMKLTYRKTKLFPEMK